MRKNFIPTAKSGFVTITGLLLVTVIITALSYMAFSVYFNRKPFDEETEESVSTDDIVTSSYKSILDDTREKIRESQNKIFDRAKELDNIH